MLMKITVIAQLFMPRLGGAYCFRRVRSQRKSVDWGTMGPALGGHTSATHTFLVAIFICLNNTVRFTARNLVSGPDHYARYGTKVAV